MYVCMYVCMHACLYVWMHVCMLLCMLLICMHFCIKYIHVVLCVLILHVHTWTSHHVIIQLITIITFTNKTSVSICTYLITTVCWGAIDTILSICQIKYDYYNYFTLHCGCEFIELCNYMWDWLFVLNHWRYHRIILTSTLSWKKVQYWAYLFNGINVLLKHR